MAEEKPWRIWRVFVLSHESNFADLKDTKVNIEVLRQENGASAYGADTMECGKLPGTITASTWYEVECTYTD